MARTTHAKNTDALGVVQDFQSQFKQSLRPQPLFDSIIDWATHPYFCNKRLYPRQKTLLKLMYLETENMTAYDIEVIEEWRKNFANKREPFGVQEDVWERVDYLKKRGYRHFPHIEAVQGRRASKGVMGGILGAEKLSWMLSLDDPQAYYGVEVGKDMYLYVVATNMVQAKRFQFADIRATVEQCKYFTKYISTSKEYYLSLRTPGDIRRIAEMKARRIPIDREIATLRALAMSSTSASGRGGTGFANFFDEFAHMITGSGGPRSSEEVYEAYQPSLDQFGQDSLTYIPSSPYTKVGKFYDLYVTGGVLMQEYLEKHGKHVLLDREDEDLQDELDPEERFTELTADPEMLIVQLPSWELYRDWDISHKLPDKNGKMGRKFSRAIQVYDDRMKRLERRNPVKFKVERRAQFAEVMDAYLDVEKVDNMFKPFWGGRVLEQTDVGRLMFVYEGHSDPGRTNANFAVAIAHTEKAPEPDKYGKIWTHVMIDHLHVWKASDYEDHTIDYVEVEKDLEALIPQYRSMKRFTFDQWNSGSFIANLKVFCKEQNMGVRILQSTFTDKTNQHRAEYFKSAINLGWIHSYKDTFFSDGLSLLELELKFLSEKNGKVVKQSVGPVTTKDLADCVMEITYRLLHEQLDMWQKELMGKQKLVTGMPSGRSDAGILSTPSVHNRGTESSSRSEIARQRLLEMKIKGSAGRRGWASPRR